MTNRRKSISAAPCKKTDVLVKTADRNAHSDGPAGNSDVNPIGNITFAQSLDPNLLLKMMVDDVSTAIVTSYGVNASNIVSQIALLFDDGLTVKFPTTSYRLVKSEGVFKAISRGENGRIEAIAEVKTFTTWLNRFSHASAMVVAIAHLISSGEISARLSKVQISVLTLQEYDKIDIHSSIQSEYYSLRYELSKKEIQTDFINNSRKVFRENRLMLFGRAKNELGRVRPLVDVDSLFRIDRNIKYKIQKSSRVTERNEAIDAAMQYLRLAVYCLQMESLAASFGDSREDQDKINVEAADELDYIAGRTRELELDISQLESKWGYRIGHRIDSVNLYNMAKICRGGSVENKHNRAYIKNKE